MDPSRPTDPDPDGTLRARFAEAVAAEAAFAGWSGAALRHANRQIGAPEGEAERLFPGGAPDVLAWLSERADQATVAALEVAGAAGLKIRDRIKLGVRT